MKLLSQVLSIWNKKISVFHNFKGQMEQKGVENTIMKLLFFWNIRGYFIMKVLTDHMVQANQTFT